MGESRNLPFKRIYSGEELLNTDVETKRKYWPIFAKMIENQLEHGGKKYALPDQSDKEITDWVCELAGWEWILGTMAKYLGRFLNFRREKDLFKIATYCFILWLKFGFHLKSEHDEDLGCVR